MRSPLWLLSLTAAAVAAPFLGGCEGETFNAQLSLTSTVTVGNANTLRFTMPVLVDVQAQPLRRDALVSLTGVVTASTSSRAAAIAKLVTIEVTHPDANTTEVKLGGVPPDARVVGTVLARVPESLNLSVRAEGGARVHGMQRDVELRTNAGAEAYDVRGSLTISTAGGVIVDTPLLQATRVDIEAVGAVVVRLPDVPSATIDVGAGQPILVRHPALPPIAPQATVYRALVATGLATLKVRTTAGGVSLEP